MNKLIRLALLLVLIGFGIWAWQKLFPSEQKVIRTRLLAVAENASFPAEQPPLRRLAQSQKLAGFFASDLEIHADVAGVGRVVLQGRDELFQTAMAAQSSGGGLKVEFLDINVDLLPDKQSALSQLTLRARRAGDSDFIVQELQVALQKVERTWLIRRAETVQTLR